MKKKLKYFGLIVLAALIVAQFFQPSLNEAKAESGYRISNTFAVPPDVAQILSASCYDCHSNNTRSMFYMHIQPVGWWVMDHVNEGKEELNFDQFGDYSLRRQYHKLEEIMEQVNENEMPLTSYTLVHGDAKLTDVQKSRLIDWANELRDTMEAHYPMDSLVRPK
jgi:hypothetical protein